MHLVLSSCFSKLVERGAKLPPSAALGSLLLVLTYEAQWVPFRMGQKEGRHLQDGGGTLQGKPPAQLLGCLPCVLLPESTRGFSDQDFLAPKTLFFMLSLAQVSWRCLEGFKNGESGDPNAKFLRWQTGKCISCSLEAPRPLSLVA